MFETFIGLMALSALLSFINHRFIKLPDTIGVMMLAILASLLLGSISFIHEQTFLNVCMVVERIDFKKLLFEFLLSFLLFAGAISVNLHHLVKERGPVITYASFGVVLSTFIIGTVFFYLAQALGFDINYVESLVFGALISPTDPVAVLALLKKAHVSEDMEIKIVGESLFNDGVGIVVFVSLLSIAAMGSAEINPGEILSLFAEEALGGVVAGVILGYLGVFFIKAARKAPIIAVHLSLAVVMGGYSLSAVFHFSGALAMVIAGLIIGYYVSAKMDSEELKTNIHIFWKVVDEIFNAVLFVLIGLEILILEFDLSRLALGLLSIVVVLLARLASVLLSNTFLSKPHRSNLNNAFILTWAGLRGGISIALALSLPEGEIRELLVFTTYVIVVFSVFFQGLSLPRLVKSLQKPQG